MTRWQRDLKVEARASAILAEARTAAAFAGYFDAQLRAARLRALGYRGMAALLRGWRNAREPARVSPGRDRGCE